MSKKNKNKETIDTPDMSIEQLQVKLDFLEAFLSDYNKERKASWSSFKKRFKDEMSELKKSIDALKIVSDKK
jgi:hypothetical protein